MLQDSQGPGTLCDLCLSQVCRSLDALCSRRSDGSMCLDRAPLFPQETADQLLHRMVTLGGLEEQKENDFLFRIKCVPTVSEHFDCVTHEFAARLK